MQLFPLLTCALAVLPNPEVTDPNYVYADFSANPIVAGAPGYSDVRQGKLGDCWFLSGLSAVVSSDPGWVLDHIRPTSADAVEVLLTGYDVPAAWYEVTRELPVDGASPAYARLSADAQETWVGFVEKSLAASRLRGAERGRYLSLSGGGPNDAFQYLLGDYGKVIWNPKLETFAQYNQPQYAICVSSRSDAANLPRSHSMVCVDSDPESLKFYDPMTGATYDGVLYWDQISAISVVEAWIPGDANGDRAVTDADYTIWADRFHSAGQSWRDAEWNADGFVSDAEYTVWADRFGSGSVTTPAPASIAVVLIGASLLTRRRARPDRRA